jgi:hypothetical protein
MKCAAAVYDSSVLPEDSGFSFERVKYVFASTSGTTKATAFTLVKQTVTEPEETAPEASPFPLLVVAIKGTERTIDWIVNANSQPRDASALFVRLFFPACAWILVQLIPLTKIYLRT